MTVAAPVKKNDQVTKIYAIAFGDVDADSYAYVKWRRQVGAKGMVHWDATPVHSYAEASKYATKEQAERAIKSVPSFDYPGIAAFVTTD